MPKYDYNANGAIDQITMPDGRVIDYIFDNQGRVNSVETTFNGAPTPTILVHSIGYKPHGPMTTWTYGNGLVQSIAYDKQYMPSDWTVGSIFDVDYTLDTGGVNIATITDNVPSGADWNQTYSYDALDRVDVEIGVQGHKDYEYDANGNRLFVRDDTQAVIQELTYEASSNRMDTRDQVDVVLDAAGNITTEGIFNRSHEYDDRGRLVRTYIAGVEKARYHYDGFGQLIRKVERPGQPDEVTRVFLYGQNGEILHLSSFKSSGVRIDKTFVWLNGVPISYIMTRYLSSGELADEVITHVHPDHLGTPRIGTDSEYGSTTITWRWQSDAFGVGNDESDPDNDGNMVHISLRFPGQFHDSQMNKFYNYFRTYDRKTGRYLESDPVGLIGGLNTYGYVYQNPLSNTDPTGEFFPQFVGFLIGAGLEYFTNPCATFSDIVFAGAFGAVGGGISKAVFLRFGPRSLSRITGKEWSHSISRSTVNRYTRGRVNQFLNRRGGINGSWVDPKRHYRHDPARFPKGYQDFGRRLPAPIRAADRAPDWLKGSAASGAAGSAIVGSDCECRQ